MGRLGIAVVCAPVVILAIVNGAWLGLAAVDRHPFWPVVTPTLAEAALTHDAGEVARLLAGGADPNGTYRVGAGLAGRRALEMTPLDAVNLSGNPDIRALLVRAGATRTTRERQGQLR